MAPSKKPSSKKAPTGRPRGRPRKHPLPAAAEPAVQSSGKALDAVNETMQPANSAAVAPDVAMLETVQPDNVSAGFTAAAQSTAQPDNSSSGSLTVAAQETMQPINASVVSAIVGGETSDTQLNVPSALPPFTAARLDKLPSPDKVLAEADSILSRSFDPAVSATPQQLPAGYYRDGTPYYSRETSPASIKSDPVRGVKTIFEIAETSQPTSPGKARLPPSPANHTASIQASVSGSPSRSNLVGSKTYAAALMGTDEETPGTQPVQTAAGPAPVGQSVPPRRMTRMQSMPSTPVPAPTLSPRKTRSQRGASAPTTAFSAADAAASASSTTASPETALSSLMSKMQPMRGRATKQRSAGVQKRTAGRKATPAALTPPVEEVQNQLVENASGQQVPSVVPSIQAQGPIPAIATRTTRSKLTSMATVTTGLVHSSDLPDAPPIPNPVAASSISSHSHKPSDDSPRFSSILPSTAMAPIGDIDLPDAPPIGRSQSTISSSLSSPATSASPATASETTGLRRSSRAKPVKPSEPPPPPITPSRAQRKRKEPPSSTPVIAPSPSSRPPRSSAIKGRAVVRAAARGRSLSEEPAAVLSSTAPPPIVKKRKTGRNSEQPVVVESAPRPPVEAMAAEAGAKAAENVRAAAGPGAIGPPPVPKRSSKSPMPPPTPQRRATRSASAAPLDIQPGPASPATSEASDRSVMLGLRLNQDASMASSVTAQPEELERRAAEWLLGFRAASAPAPRATPPRSTPPMVECPLCGTSTTEAALAAHFDECASWNSDEEEEVVEEDEGEKRPMPYFVPNMTLEEGFSPVPDLEEFRRLLEDPGTTPEQRLAVSESLVWSMYNAQDEWLAIKGTLAARGVDSLPRPAAARKRGSKGKFGAGQRKAGHPWEPEHPTVWEDQKEAMLYDYKWDPAVEKRGKQDPIAQSEKLRSRRAGLRATFEHPQVYPGYEAPGSVREPMQTRGRKGPAPHSRNISPTKTTAPPPPPAPPPTAETPAPPVKRGPGRPRKNAAPAGTTAHVAEGILSLHFGASGRESMGSILSREPTPAPPAPHTGKTYKTPTWHEMGVQPPKPTLEEEFQAAAAQHDLGKRRRASADEGVAGKKRM